MSDPEMAKLFLECLSHLLCIVSYSKDGMQEARESLSDINEFYLERIRYSQPAAGPTGVEVGSVQLQSTNVSEPFVFDSE
jgi:hypothetical protein